MVKVIALKPTCRLKHASSPRNRRLYKHVLIDMSQNANLHAHARALEFDWLILIGL